MNYYVSTSGNDSSPGDKNFPWKTIQHALDFAFAGDSIFVRTGIYYESLVFSHSGNSVKGHIVLTCYPYEKPVIDGKNTGQNTGLNITTVSYITIAGFEIRNWTENVINVTEGSHHLVFSDLKVHDFGFGVTFYNDCHDITLTRVESYNYGSSGISYGFDCSYDISQNRPNHDFVFNDCIAHGDPAATDNIDGFATGHQAATHWQYNFIYNHCIAYDVYDGFDMDAKYTSLNRCMAFNCKNGCYKLWSDKITMTNCLGYKPFGACVELDYPSELPGYKKTVTLQNCTFFGGESSIWIEHTSTDTLVMRNCIVSGSQFIGLSFYESNVTKLNYKGDYNLFHCSEMLRIVSAGGVNDYTFPEWQSFSGQDKHSLAVADISTVFTDTASDFHLKTGSPAIDKGGTAYAPVNDIENKYRPFGKGYDIGAYEWGSSGEINIKTGSGNFKIYPNPAKEFVFMEFPGEDSYLFRIYNEAGSVVRSGISESSAAFRLDLGGFCSGYYFVRAVNRTQALVCKGSFFIVL